VTDDLLEFYGTECAPCIEMRPVIERLEKEEGVKITRVEVWHSAKNLEAMKQYDKGYCGGVPFFFNKKTGNWICGSTSYENLKKWALGG